MNYAEMVADVMPDVMGCPSPMVERAIRSAFIELCERGYVYEVEQGPETIPAGTDEFFLELPARTRLLGVLSLKAGDRPLAPLTREDLDLYAGDWREPGFTYGYTIGPQDTVRLVRPPTEAIDLDVYSRFVVAPTLRSVALPDALATRWYDGLIAGAAARLLDSAGASWSNPELAARRRATFNSAVAKARLLFSQDSVNATRVVVSNAFI